MSAPGAAGSWIEVFGVGGEELVLIMLLALFIIGPDRMPKLARDLGRTIGDLRRTSDELREEFLNADLRALTAAEEAKRPPPEPAFDKDLREARERVEAQVRSDAAAALAAKTPPQPPESAFDRELREARERIAAGGAPPPA